MDTRAVALGALSQLPPEQRIDDPPWLMTELAALLTERGRQNAPSDVPAVLSALREQLCLRHGDRAVQKLQKADAPRFRAAIDAVSRAVQAQLEDVLVETSLQQLPREASTREERMLLQRYAHLFQLLARLIARTLLARRQASTVWTPSAERVLQAVAAQAEAGRKLGAGWFAERWPLLVVLVQAMVVQQATLLAQDPRSLLALHLPPREGQGAAGEWSPVESLQHAQRRVMEAARTRRGAAQPQPLLGGSVRHNGERWARVLASGRIITEGEERLARELDPASLPARPLFVLDADQLRARVASSWLTLSHAELPQLVSAAREAGPETLRRLLQAVRSHRPELARAALAEANESGSE
ncbi:MAG: hypothetical protein U1A78_40035 [Polyangia bacterium]